MPEDQTMSRGRERLFFLGNAERQLAFPSLRSRRSWVVVEETYTRRFSGEPDPAQQQEGAAGRRLVGEQDGVGSWGKLSSFTAGEGAREQGGRYAPFVKPCLGSAQPAFSDAQAWEPRMALFQNVLALGRAVIPSVSRSTLAPCLSRRNAQDSFSFWIFFSFADRFICTIFLDFTYRQYLFFSFGLTSLCMTASRSIQMSRTNVWTPRGERGCELNWEIGINVHALGFSDGSAGKESACSARGLGWNPWVGKIPWRREWLPTLVLWPGEFYGLYRPWGCKATAQDTTERLSLSLLILCIK